MADRYALVPVARERRGLVSRVLSWFSRTSPTEVVPVRGDASPYPQPHGYDPLTSMSAYSAFAWIFAASNAITQDVGSRPVRLYRRRPGAEDEEVVDHPALELLEQPSSRISRAHFDRQRVLDRVLEGNSYTLLVSDYAGQPLSMLRLHPARVEIEATPDGLPDVYVYDSRLRYSYDHVLHVRGASYEDDGRGLYGQGLIRALHRELAADLASWQRQAQQHARGRPDYIVTPDKGDLGAWSRDQVAQVRDAIDRMLHTNHGGVGIAPASAKFERLSWSDADLGVTSMREEIRDRVLGAAGVPPTRVSLPTANYAQSAEQMRGYWQHTIMPLAGELDRADTRVVKLLDPTLYVKRDFSDVPVLQADATARLQRVQLHWTMGVPLASAYRAEGLTPPDGVEGADTEGESSGRSLVDWLTRAEPPTEAALADRWTRYVERAQGPTEARLRRELSLYFRGLARRVATAAGENTRAWTRATADERLREVFDLALETEALTDLLTPELLRALEVGFDDARTDLPLELVFNPDRTSGTPEIARLVSQVHQTTIDALRVTIRESIDSAESIAQLQARILTMPQFSPMRALRIARTESTRFTNVGAHDAARAAAGEGLRIRRTWSAEIDAVTRDTHVAANGQTVGVDEEFRLDDGTTGMQPGDPSLGAANVVNCRCGVLLTVER